MMTRHECEAAMCIWEYALNPVDGHKEYAEYFLDWLGTDDGYTQARQTVMKITPLCETSYIWAKHHGYDDSFDSEFIPRWCYYAIMRNRPSDLDETWAIMIGMKIHKEFVN